MYSARDNKGHSKLCLTLIFKVNYKGQVTYVSHFEIPNIGCLNRQQGKACITYTTHDEQWVTISNCDLDFQGHMLRTNEKI